MNLFARKYLLAWCSVQILLGATLAVGEPVLPGDEGEKAPEVSYYEDSKSFNRKGWYGYEKEVPKPKEKKKDKKTEAATSPAKPERKVPSLKDYTIKELWNMHPDDFVQVLTDFEKKAVQTLDPNDMKEYRTVKDVARRKALAFASVDAYAAQQDPTTNTEGTMPRVPAAAEADFRNSQKLVSDRLNRAQSDHALIYFMSKSCGYCVEQRETIDKFNGVYRWNVKEVDILKEPALAKRFNITVTPTLLLIKKGETNYTPISYGSVSVLELQSRIYRGVRLMAGEITPQEYATYENQQGGVMDPTALLEK